MGSKFWFRALTLTAMTPGGLIVKLVAVDQFQNAAPCAMCGSVFLRDRGNPKILASVWRIGNHCVSKSASRNGPRNEVGGRKEGREEARWEERCARGDIGGGVDVSGIGF